jgi:hypothetical protein
MGQWHKKFYFVGSVFLLIHTVHTLRKRERAHVQSTLYKMKSLFQLQKLRFHGQWATLFHIRFLLSTYVVPSPLAASKKEPQKPGICANTSRWRGSRAPGMGPGVNTCGWVGGPGKGGLMRWWLHLLLMGGGLVPTGTQVTLHPPPPFISQCA